jgi:hypothetical protein
MSKLEVDKLMLGGYPKSMSGFVKATANVDQ